MFLVCVSPLASVGGRAGRGFSVAHSPPSIVSPRPAVGPMGAPVRMPRARASLDDTATLYQPRRHRPRRPNRRRYGALSGPLAGQKITQKPTETPQPTPLAE
ncbi:hypothetical protein GWI33_014275 [Rhynchophorus ferrugineus]|uniref:Uncharacterized protein n=1 Tax=Rhynchophorus ferrugineus TaxID=354439 RepID=A0A834I7Q0_RHYFE|nr:hypothetical protein GWI33_014275 [Rhynchophorus ferrugineus]